MPEKSEKVSTFAGITCQLSPEFALDDAVEKGCVDMQVEIWIFYRYKRPQAYPFVANGQIEISQKQLIPKIFCNQIYVYIACQQYKKAQKTHQCEPKSCYFSNQFFYLRMFKILFTFD